MCLLIFVVLVLYDILAAHILHFAKFSSVSEKKSTNNLFSSF
ncbi:unnamed protein product [Acanthoscelides obtectus]|uniref:Uncharacterized protein n=1 Tax=Acanthoscelides obtectus TaxID=200917 RepID=A0A9P0LJ42_ACAOB|nr:unnamed protein product [Acanthoscelides obtectus]CAK1649784.1 hypothetical protein AOBTE_LOCUS16432 [Acanthoscelides obtectus]